MCAGFHPATVPSWHDHGDNRLTLFTERVILDQRRSGGRVGQARRQAVRRRRELQRRLDADGLGLTGERDAAPNLLVWLELLAGAALVTAYPRVALVAHSSVARLRAGDCALVVVLLRERGAPPARDALTAHTHAARSLRVLPLRAIPLLPGVHVRVRQYPGSDPHSRRHVVRMRMSRLALAAGAAALSLTMLAPLPAGAAKATTAAKARSRRSSRCRSARRAPTRRTG